MMMMMMTCSYVDMMLQICTSDMVVWVPGQVVTHAHWSLVPDTYTGDGTGTLTELTLLLHGTE